MFVINMGLMLFKKEKFQMTVTMMNRVLNGYVTYGYRTYGMFYCNSIIYLFSNYFQIKLENEEDGDFEIIDESEEKELKEEFVPGWIKREECQDNQNGVSHKGISGCCL